MDAQVWKILQFVISPIIGVAGIIYRWYLYKEIKKKESDPKLDALNFIFYKPMALAFLIFISTIVAELKLVNFADFLNSKPKVNDLSKNLNKTYSEISENAILTSILDEKVTNLNEFATYATNNEKVLIIENNTKEFSESANKIFQNAENDSKIYATSYVKPDKWWKDEEGQDYLKMNYKFITEKKGQIIRIHLFNDETEYKFFSEIMKSEKENKVEVYYIYTKDIPASYNLKQDIIVVPNQFTGKLALDEERNPLSVSYYASKKIIDENQQIIDRLLNLKEIKKY